MGRKRKYPPLRYGLMNVLNRYGCLSRVAGLILLACSSARGHDCGSPSYFEFSTNDIGKLTPYFIYADVAEAGLSLYSVDSNLSNSVADVVVVTPANFLFGLFLIKPKAEGATVVNLKWEYPPNSAVAYCQLQIRVGAAAAARYPAADIVHDVSILEPVNAASGELTEGPFIDFDLGGPMPLRFGRYYASKMNLDGRTGNAFKQNWTHNFETRAYVLSNRVDIITYTGRRTGRAWL